MKTTPFKHQAKEYEASRDIKARALLWQMRTGKSKVVIDTIFHLRDAFEIAGALILAPNGVHANWTRRELPRHAWDDDWSGLAWRSRKPGMDDEAALFTQRAPFPILAVNNEVLGLPRVQTVIKDLLKRGPILFAADESHDFRRPGSKRTKLARTLSAKCEYRRILTGTAVLNSPLHAFSQFELLKKEALGFRLYEDFRNHFATCTMRRRRSGRMFPHWEPRNLDELRDKLAPYSSVVLRKDVDDMPALIPIDQTVFLSEAQALAYRHMTQDWTIELLNGGSVTVLEGAAKMMKLQQILGGFIIDNDGVIHSIDDNPPRLDAMLSQVTGTLPGKTIVWCRYQEDIRRVVTKLRAYGFDPVEYHGSVSAGERDKAEDRFREDTRANPLVGQPQSAGQGLDLSAADTIVNYSHVHNAIVREQSKERATAIGGKSVGLVDLHTPGSVDDLILDAMERNLSVSEYLAGPGLKHRLLELLAAVDL